MTASSPEPTLAVAVPCFNCARVLERCVDSILRSAEACPQVREILLIDGSSADDTSEVCRRLSTHPLVRVIVHEQTSTSAKRNCVLRHTDADYLVYTDPDCIATPGWLAAYAAAAQEWAYCTGRVLPWGEGQHVSVRLSPESRIFPPGLLYRCFPFRPGSSNNMMVARVLLERLGGFDEGIGPGTPVVLAGEDAELNYRVLREGIPIRYVAEAAVHHDHAETIGQFLQKKENYACGLSYLLLRHYGDDAAAYLSFAVMMGHSMARVALNAVLMRPLRVRQALREVRGRAQGAWLARQK